MLLPYIYRVGKQLSRLAYIKLEVYLDHKITVRDINGNVITTLKYKGISRNELIQRMKNASDTEIFLDLDAPSEIQGRQKR
jgi:hypothetical protein